MVPIDIGRDEARRAAHRELGKAIYQQHQPSPLQRLLSDISGALNRLLHAADGSTPSGWVGLAVIVLLIVGVAVLVRHRTGVLQRSRTLQRAVILDDAEWTAAQQRAAAANHAERGEWAEAIRDRMRAVALSLEERALLEPRPGRTADEIASEAATRLPDRRDDLRGAAQVFDDVWYGGRAAGSEEYELISAVDERVEDAKPVLAESGA